MFSFQRRSRSLVVALCLAAAGLAAPAAVSGPAAAAVHPPPSPSNEGPAGPPAQMPNGRVAPPPRVLSPQVSTGCPAAPRGVNSYAPGSGKTVALTFDDGPGASTSRILSILSSAGVTATFFNIGQNAAARPPRVRDEVQRGFMVGNHTWDHPIMAGLSASGQAAEMDRATAEQTRLVGMPPCAFRPPYGYPDYNSTTERLAQQRRMKFWTWSVDTEDWKANGSSSRFWVDRIIRLAEQEGGALRHPVVLMHNAPSGDPATARALPTIINFFRHRGYTFVDLLGLTRLGYYQLTSNGGVHNYGAPFYGSDRGTLSAGVKTIGLAPDPVTGGYWLLRSDGGVDPYNAPWYGSLKSDGLTGRTVTAIASSRGGYLVLTANGGVYNYGAPWYGSARGTLPAGVTAVGLAANPATGGYWILTSDGGVNQYNAPWYGSVKHDGLTGLTVTALATSPVTGGYWILTSQGGVYNYGAPWYGSARGTLPAGVTGAGLAANPATGGYWILTSDGGVAQYHAPWYGSVKHDGLTRLTVTAITGQ
jgi:peptidoglycan/xylan/chitin deacetylase (PgdA/CDA1 family)